MKKIYKFLTFFFFIGMLAANAQTGKVAGTVLDGEYNEPLAFANILVKGTTKGTTSDFDGKYVLELEPGTYTLIFSFVGYKNVEMNEVVVKAGQVNTLEVTLGANTLDAVVIKSSVKKNTEASVLNYQKKSAMLLDGISSQTISKMGASNLASAVKSVPGVSIQGGKYVYVRGLGDRYTKSILNGVDIPGLDPDRNTIQMDIFPTNILDNIIVLKSAAAEYPADFTGGVVNIVTKDFPTQFEASISVGLGYNPKMHFNEDYLTYKGSKTDFWGYDNGFRKKPIHRYQPIPGTFENRLTLKSLTNRFKKELRAKKEKSGMDYDFGFTLGNQHDVGDNTLGYMVSFSYKNNTEFYEKRVDGSYRKNTNDNTVNELQLDNISNGSEGINNVIVNGLAGVTFKTNLSKYSVKLLHIQNGESAAGYFNQSKSQASGGSGLENIVKNSLTYTERAVTNLLISGKHTLGVAENPWKMDWKVSPTYSKVMDRDHRITPLQVQDGLHFISPSTVGNPIRIWRKLQEENWVGKLDFNKHFTLFNRPAKVKMGGSFVTKFRDYSIDEFTFDIVGDASFIADGNVNNLLAEENLWDNKKKEGTHLMFKDKNKAFNPNNAYEGKQQIFATYASLEFNVAEKLKTVLGLRTELFQSYYTGQDDSVIYDDKKQLDKFDLFPSVNLIYSITDNSKIRASYSKTTARPSFKEASKSQIYDPITNRLFIGTLNLVPTYVNNFDLRYEVFREKGQMFAVSGFYKDFKDPIELTFFEDASKQITPKNLGNAKVYGVELEFRQRLGFLSESLEDLQFKANASYIKSALEMGDAEYNNRTRAGVLRVGESVDRKRDLQGQSPYLINAGLDYSNFENGLQIGLFYNIQGKTLEVVGTGVVPDVYTKPFHSLNFALNKSFGENKKSSIDFKVKNILGQEKKSVYESFKATDQIYSLRVPGTEFSLGYTYKF